MIQSGWVTVRIPAGFHINATGEVVCPCRSTSCCDRCAAKHEEIVEVYGQHFWEPDKAERESLLRDMAADKEQRRKDARRSSK